MSYGGFGERHRVGIARFTHVAEGETPVDVGSPVDDLAENLACVPAPLDRAGFNLNSAIPFGVTTQHIRAAMEEFLSFIGFINQSLHSRGIKRFETMLMPASFSSMVGEFVSSSIPTHCPTIAKNSYHNGHPDMVPAGLFPNDSVQHSDQGIEVKGSRYLKAWQGHNVEDTWLMVFVFASNRPVDVARGLKPIPFRFVKVLGAKLLKSDWKFSGRGEDSRRTITASVTDSGFQKMEANWIYRDASMAGLIRHLVEGDDLEV